MPPASLVTMENQILSAWKTLTWATFLICTLSATTKTSVLLMSSPTETSLEALLAWPGLPLLQVTHICTYHYKQRLVLRSVSLVFTSFMWKLKETSFIVEPFLSKLSFSLFSDETCQLTNFSVKRVFYVECFMFFFNYNFILFHRNFHII